MAKDEPVEKEQEKSDVQTGTWDDHVKVRSRKFNGPTSVGDPLRIAMSKEAYADVIGHAKESLDREICGVLLGDLCEDEYGLFIDIRAALRGGAAKGGGTHVTFTQETWNQIHTAREENYPKLQIVGWYHSHPGFGVEFSDMDRFIQKNFFGGQGQIAFVTDPLGGGEAIDANIDGEITPVERFWVDGRERRCYVPAKKGGGAAEEGSAKGAGGVSSDALRVLEDRIRQLTDAVEKQRNTFYNFLMFLGTLLAACCIIGLGYSVMRSYYRPIEVPEELKNEFTVPLPLVDPQGKMTMLTMTAKRWNVSPELEQQVWQMMLEKHKDELAAIVQQAVAAATQRAATQTAPATAPSSAPAGAPK